MAIAVEWVKVALERIEASTACFSLRGIFVTERENSTCTAFDELMRLADKVFNVGRDSLPRFKLRNFRDPSDRSFLLVFVQEANFLFEKSTIGREFGN